MRSTRACGAVGVAGEAVSKDCLVGGSLGTSVFVDGSTGNAVLVGGSTGSLVLVGKASNGVFVGIGDVSAVTSRV